MAGWNALVVSMDIIASILAYLLCMTGLVTGVVVSFVIFFSSPGPQAEAPASAIAMVAKPGAVVPVKAFPVKPIAGSQQANARKQSADADVTTHPAAIAPDASQKPPLSPKRMRRLAEQERARHLAYRERSSFEARFLHYDD